MTREDFLQEAARIHGEWEEAVRSIKDKGDEVDTGYLLEVYHSRIDALMDEYHAASEGAAH